MSLVAGHWGSSRQEMGSVTSIFKASSDGTVKDVLHGAPSGT